MELYNRQKTYTGYRLLSAVLILLIISQLQSCKGLINSDKNPEIRHAEVLLYSDIDSASSIISHIDTASLDEHELMQWQMMNEYIRINYEKLEEESPKWEQLIDYFSSTDDQLHLAESYFIQGEGYHSLGMYAKATEAFKQTENYTAILRDSLLLGLLYYRLGTTAGNEALYSVAYDYFNRALPYFSGKQAHKMLALCYRDLARTVPDSVAANKEEKLFNNAIYHATIYGDSVTYYDILLHRAMHQNDIDTAYALSLCVTLVDSLRAYSYADVCAEFYLAMSNVDEASKYLDMYYTQTLYSEWANERYRLLDAWRKAKLGDNNTAFDELRQLYNDLYAQLEENGRLRAYTISRRYDLEKEQAINLQLTNEKQHAWILIGAVVVILLIVIIVFLLMMMHSRNRRLDAERKQMQAEAQSKVLNNALKQRRQLLKQNLLQRIEVTRSLCEARMNKKVNLPANVQTQLSTILFTDPEQWQRFRLEFDDAYDGLLTRIHNNYPQLTDSDIQYIALNIMQLKVSDICILLDVQPRTIWTRRLRMKMRIGDVNLDLDQWIKQMSSK